MGGAGVYILYDWNGFAWDTGKEAANKAKHGISFETASAVFDDVVFVRADQRRDYGEARYVAIGHAEETILAVVFTIREPNICRIISARGANRHERAVYRQG